MSAEEYLNELCKTLRDAIKSEREGIQKVSEMVADSVTNGGVLHVFGTGHTMILAEEVFYRAGSLAAINAMLDNGVSIHFGGPKSSQMERLEGYADIIISQYDVRPGEVIIILSNSGRNAVPIEMAMAARRKGLRIVAVTSLGFSRSVPSRHSSGKRLFELADIVIDNKVPPGDATMEIRELRQKMGPISTIINAVILHTIIMQACQVMLKKGFAPPVWMSANLEGGDEFNLEYISRYKSRAKHLG
jgi:uncharacterized phosphosugar-binding protein